MTAKSRSTGWPPESRGKSWQASQDAQTTRETDHAERSQHTLAMRTKVGPSGMAVQPRLSEVDIAADSSRRTELARTAAAISRPETKAHDQT